MAHSGVEHNRILITVRTYPVPARKGIEVSCTAGITEQGSWVRLYPVPYRFMGEDKRFKKYQWIDVDTRRPPSDPRLESRVPDLDSLRISSQPVTTRSNWAERKEIVYPLKSPSLCYLRNKRDTTGSPTLGLFKPKVIKRLVIQKDRGDWTETELARLRQYSMWETAPHRELVKIPFKFIYEFTCDEPGCNTHRLSCTDWEMGQSYLSWLRRYGDGWVDAFRNRYEKEMIEQNDTHFYVGTVNNHPSEWIIVGLWYPRIQLQPQLI